MIRRATKNHQLQMAQMDVEHLKKVTAIQSDIIASLRSSIASLEERIAIKDSLLAMAGIAVPKAADPSVH